MTPKFITRFSSEAAGDRYLHIQTNPSKVPGGQPVVIFYYSEDPEAPVGYQRTVGPSPPSTLQLTAQEIVKSFNG